MSTVLLLKRHKEAALPNAGYTVLPGQSGVPGAARPAVMVPLRCVESTSSVAAREAT